VQAVFAEFGETWSEEKWVRVFSSLSDEDTTAMRQHFTKTKFIQTSLELLKRMPAYQQMVEEERRHSEVFRHAKAMMEKELFEKFSKNDTFRRGSALDFFNVCNPLPVMVGSSLLFGSSASPISGIGNPFGTQVPSMGHFQFGSCFEPRPPTGSSSSSDGLVLSTPPSGSPFGVDAPVAPILDVSQICALELAMSNAELMEDDEDDDDL
jgi:hypothetical protein